MWNTEFDHCTSYTTRPVKPLNIEFSVSNTDILAKIWDFSHFWPKFTQKCHCDVILRCPILFISFDHCTSYTTHAVKPLNIEFGVFNTEILAKICDFSYFGPKFAQISLYDVTLRTEKPSGMYIRYALYIIYPKRQLYVKSLDFMRKKQSCSYFLLQICPIFSLWRHKKYLNDLWWPYKFHQVFFHH